MSSAESLKLMDDTRDMVENTRLAIDAMEAINQHKTAKELAIALTNMLNAVARKLDGE